MLCHLHIRVFSMLCSVCIPCCRLSSHHMCILLTTILLTTIHGGIYCRMGTPHAVVQRSALLLLLKKGAGPSPIKPCPSAHNFTSWANCQGSAASQAICGLQMHIGARGPKQGLFGCVKQPQVCMVVVCVCGGGLLDEGRLQFRRNHSWLLLYLW
jgi:hypothetical protein